MSHKKKVLIFIGLLVFIILIWAALLYFFDNSGQDDDRDDPAVISYTDPYSGETIYDVEGKVSEGYGGDTVTFLGLERLLEVGYTLDQIDIYKSTIDRYSGIRIEKGESRIDEVTIDFSTYVDDLDRGSGERSVRFDVILNRDENLRYYIEFTSYFIDDLAVAVYTDKARTKQVPDLIPRPPASL